MVNSVATTILRTVPGAYVLNSGLSKLQMDEDTAAFLQGEAAKGIPALANLDTKTFAKVLTYGEIAVGGAMLLPIIPNRVAGLALGALSAGLVASYFGNPDMTQEDGVRPSQDGTSLAKDTWLAAIALALLATGGKKKKKKK